MTVQLLYSNIFSYLHVILINKQCRRFDASEKLFLLEKSEFLKYFHLIQRNK